MADRASAAAGSLKRPAERQAQANPRREKVPGAAVGEPAEKALSDFFGKRMRPAANSAVFLTAWALGQMGRVITGRPEFIARLRETGRRDGSCRPLKRV